MAAATPTVVRRSPKNTTANPTPITGRKNWAGATRATPPLDKLLRAMRQNTLVRIYEEFDRDFADIHLKDLTVDEIGPGRVLRGLLRRIDREANCENVSG